MVPHNNSCRTHTCYHHPFTDQKKIPTLLAESGFSAYAGVSKCEEQITGPEDRKRNSIPSRWHLLLCPWSTSRG